MSVAILIMVSLLTFILGLLIGLFSGGGTKEVIKDVVQVLGIDEYGPPPYDREKSYANWHPGEPNNYNGEQTTTLMPNGLWNDVSGTNRRRALCKIKATGELTLTSGAYASVDYFHIIKDCAEQGGIWWRPMNEEENKRATQLVIDAGENEVYLNLATTLH